MIRFAQRLLNEHSLRQTAHNFREAADLPLEGSAADFALSQAFTHAGYKGVPRKVARMTALLALAAHPKMSEGAIIQRTKLYMEEWEKGNVRRRAEKSRREAALHPFA